MSKWMVPDNERSLAHAVSAARSIAEVCRILGLRPAGGNYRTVKIHAARLRLDTSHHAGQAWSRGIPGNYSEPGTSRRPQTLRRALIRKYGHRCWRCQLTIWQGEPIPLELEHRDGNHENNAPANLALLCCNCHAMTSTWRGRKRAPVAQPAEASILNMAISAGSTPAGGTP
jgi:hypothetical protein